jgi:hypothetical protein
MANYQPVLGMLGEMQRALAADAPMATQSQAFVAIVSMAWTSMPLGATQHTRKEMIEWAEKYLRASPTSAYQQTGLDVYAARCSVLHSKGNYADLHSNANPRVVFGYRGGDDNHLFDAAEIFFFDQHRCTDRRQLDASI